MVTQIDENGHRENEVPLWVALELVQSGQYEWKVGNIIQKKLASSVSSGREAEYSLHECPYCHKQIRDYDGDYSEHIADCDSRFLQNYERQHEEREPYFEYGDEGLNEDCGDGDHSGEE